MYEIKKAMDDLGENFQAFKKKNEDRLANIEKGFEDMHGQQQVLQTLEEKMQETIQKVNRIEISGLRPQTSLTEGKKQNFAEHKNAFLQYVTKGDDREILAYEQKNLSTASDPDGGYLVPSFLSQKILETIQDHSTIRGLASSTVISTDAIELLREEEQTGAGWATETGQRDPTSTPKLKKIRIPVHEMYAKPRATQKLLDDAQINVEQWLYQKISNQFAALENKAFLFGDGVGKPRGILSHDITYENQGEWGKIKGIKAIDGKKLHSDLLVQLVYKLPSQYLQGATWVMPRAMLSMIRTLKDGNGQYLWNPGMNGDQQSALLGYPVVVCDDFSDMKSDDEASVGILFGNFKEGYQIVDHAATRILRDPYSAKPHVEFYATRRVGGDITNYDAFSVLTFDK